MKKLLHYAKCCVAIFIKYTTYISKKVLRYIMCFQAIIKCICGTSSETTKVVLNLNEVQNRAKAEHLIRKFQFQECEYSLSIIIPLFNVAQYIDECLNSILQQKTQFSYEIILIDDGSTDNTCQVLQQFLKQDNIILLQQENQGQSAARNRAISQSKGRYLMFVDGDDILLPDTIETLIGMAIATQSDIAEGKVFRFYNEADIGKLKQSRRVSIKSNSKNPKFVLTCCGYSVAKVYKRELWETLRYPEGYIFEDVITKFILRRKANQVAFVDMFVYGYRQNLNSSSHGSNQMKKLDSIWVYPKIVELCKQQAVPFDDVFYLLSLNHIGLLNYVVLRSHKQEVKQAGFRELRKQLVAIQEYRAKKLPLMFRVLEKSILDGNFENWEYIAKTIVEYEMLKKWREIN